MDPSKRDDFLMFEELNYSLSKLKITDSNFIDNARSNSFLNIVSTRKGTDSRSFYKLDAENADRHLIYAKFLMVSHEGQIHSRKVTSILLELCRIGGMLKIMTSAGAFLFYWFVQPFRELDLAVSYNKLKSQICKEEKLVDENHAFDK